MFSFTDPFRPSLVFESVPEIPMEIPMEIPNGQNPGGYYVE